MTNFPVHTIESAPERSKPAMQQLQSAFGMIPNIVGAIATSPVLINSLVGLFGNVHGASFTEAQVQIVLLTDAVTNRSAWAVAFHTALALKEGIDPKDVHAIREGRLPKDGKFGALSGLAKAMIEKRGHLDDQDVDRFLAAGFGKDHLLEVIAAIAASTITNYTGSITKPPLEAPFNEHAWQVEGSAMKTAPRSLHATDLVGSTTRFRTNHPFTDADLMAQVRAMAEPNKGKLRGVGARLLFDDIIGHTATPERVDFREGKVGGVSGWWAEPEGAVSGRVVLHLHGGWFNWGTAHAYRNLVGHIARSAAAVAFVPDYGLAPEHPFPAAGLDAEAALGGLIADGTRAIAVTGDSAGGNLALALLSSATARTPAGRRHIVGAVVLSPVTDLTLGGRSWINRAQADPYFLKDQVQSLIDGYLAGHKPTDPAASPLFADPTGFPPIRLHVGDAEVLLDDAVRYAERAVAAGVDARLDVWEGMAHGFLGSVGRFQAADAALDLIAVFLRDRLSLVGG